jgi:hypothetical protein
LLVACACLATTVAHAQFRASIQGTVTDKTGAVIPGATVTLTDTATDHVLKTTTSGAGVYTFNALPPSKFNMTVDAAGFKKKTLSGVQIRPEQANAVNVQLDLGQSSQTVTVNGGQSNLLDTETATLSGTVTSKQIQHLPSFNRDVFQLAQLAPGVFGDGSQGSAGGTFNLPGNAGPGGSASTAAGIFQTENQVQVQAVGGQTDQNGISVDGISTVSAVWGGASVITPSEDSIQNVTIVTNSYDAENGRFSGAQMQVISKSGTNHLHGSAFFKASRPGLNAYQRFNGYRPGITPTSTPADKGVNRDDDRTNNYGGSLGGPIWKNRIFAFFDYETSPLTGLVTAQQWFETPQFDTIAAKAGSIAAKYLAYPGEKPPNTATLVPENCGQIGLTEGVNCKTTAQGLDVGSPIKAPLGHQDLTYGGNNGTPGVGGGLDGIPDLALYNTVDPTNISQAQYNGRLDVLPDQNDHVTFAIYWVPVTQTDYNGPVRSANLWHHSQINDAFSLIWNHTFSPTLLNQARANAAGYRWNEVATNPQAPFGLPQDNITQYNLTGGFQYFGAPPPSDLDQWTYDYNDILTKTLSSQNIKMGASVTRLYYLNNPVNDARPSFSFDNLWDFANDAPYNETGEFDSATGVPFANRQDDRENIFAAFLQDDYKVLPNLTLNLGLRWSYFGGMYSKQNNLDVVQFGTGSNPLSGLNLRVGGHLYSPQKTNFGPQFGFSWQPKESNDKAVVRGGFGVDYNQNEIAILANGAGNPPNAVTGNFVCPYPYTNDPTCSGHGLLYETAPNVHSLFGFAPNPAAITAFGSDNLPVNYGNGSFVTGYQANPKTIVVYHYSLGYEYQLPYDSVFTLGYQGNLSRHMLTQMNYNVVALAQGHTLNPKVNFLDYYPNTANGNYNAMIATVRHNFAHEFQAEVQYTWAKTMDEGSSPYEEDPYPFDVHEAYGRADYNVQNAFKVFGLWQPIFFRGSHSWAEKVFGGWSLGGIYNAHSGFPFNPVYNTTGPYYQGSGYTTLRPAGVVGGAGTKTGNSVFMGASNPNYGTNPTKYFVPPTYVQGPAFPATAPPPVPGIHRNSLTGPGYKDLDASLTKAFGIPNNRVLGQSAVFEVRADAYNLFNEINLDGASMDDTVGSAAPNGTVTSINTHFGVPFNALGSRTVQLQARFSF